MDRDMPTLVRLLKLRVLAFGSGAFASNLRHTDYDDPDTVRSVCVLPGGASVVMTRDSDVLDDRARLFHADGTPMGEDRDVCDSASFADLMGAVDAETFDVDGPAPPVELAELVDLVVSSHEHAMFHLVEALFDEGDTVECSDLPPEWEPTPVSRLLAHAAAEAEDPVLREAARAFSDVADGVAAPRAWDAASSMDRWWNTVFDDRPVSVPWAARGA